MSVGYRLGELNGLPCPRFEGAGRNIASPGVWYPPGWLGRADWGGGLATDGRFACDGA